MDISGICSTCQRRVRSYVMTDLVRGRKEKFFVTVDHNVIGSNKICPGSGLTAEQVTIDGKKSDT